MDWIPRSEKSPREENGYPLQYSFLENSTDREPNGYSPWGQKELDRTEQLTLFFTFNSIKIVE